MQFYKNIKNLSEDNFLGCKTKYLTTPRNSYLASWLISIAIKKEDTTFGGDNIVNIQQSAFQDGNLYVKTTDTCRILYCVREPIVPEMC
jgi:hypothetical protein